MNRENYEITARYHNENVYIEIQDNEVNIIGMDTSIIDSFIFFGIEDLNISVQKNKDYFEMTISDKFVGDSLDCIYIDSENYKKLNKQHLILLNKLGKTIDNDFEVNKSIELYDKAEHETLYPQNHEIKVIQNNTDQLSEEACSTFVNIDSLNELDSNLMISVDEYAKSIPDKHEKNLFISVKFKKDFKEIKDKDKRLYIIDILNNLSNMLNSNPSEVNRYLKKLNAKKFNSINEFWKFYVTKSQRIIYSYGKNFGRNDQKDSIFILRFVEDHDEQSKLAEKASKLSFKESFLYENRTINTPIDDALVMEDYDIDNDISYIALAGQVEDVLLGKNKNHGVLLNTEQISCINNDTPLIVKGSAGSGKTVVSIEIMKLAYKASTDSVYITFTEGLKKHAKNQFESLLKTETNNFYSFSEYCINNLGLSKMQYSGFREFMNWYLGSYMHLSFKIIDIWHEIRGVVKGFMGENWLQEASFKRLLDEEDYIGKKGFDSKFNEFERREIYRIVTKYNEWLDNANKFDDNDLAYQMFLMYEEGKQDKIPILVIDEVQDFTERQIVMMSYITFDYHIYLCGDPNQIINPTLFSFGRVSNFFYNRQSKSPRMISLKNNYRNSAPVVEIINNITMKRKTLIGFQKREDDALERPMRTDTFGTRLLNVHPTEENLKEVVSLFEKTPSAAIIVTTDDEREVLEKKINSKLNSVFTIFEVKGLEFNHVFCYNIFSGYKDIWNEIMNGHGKRSSAHRFHFNVLYVAITRSKEYISFFEDSKNTFLINDLDVRYIEKVDEDSMEINSLRDPFEWYEDGVMFEKAGLYNKAILAYEKHYDFSGINMKKDISRCEANIILETNKTFEGFFKAGNLLIEAEDYLGAERIFSDIDVKYKIHECQIRRGMYKHRSHLSKEEMNSILLQGMDDEVFFKLFIEAYLIPKSRDLVTNSEMIKGILLPELLEVML